MGRTPLHQGNRQIIGIDLDNTIICYDEALHKLASDRGFIEKNVPADNMTKKYIRDRILNLTGDDTEWQKIQAILYTKKMEEAKLFPDVAGFFKLVKKQNIQIFIISHKTEYARYDEAYMPLREVAFLWMRRNHFFDVSGLSLNPAQIFFESTRQKKIERIISLGCTVFIDDLLELFSEDSFPMNVEKILFNQHKIANSTESTIENLKVFRSWKEITENFFPTPRRKKVNS